MAAAAERHHGAVRPAAAKGVVSLHIHRSTKRVVSITWFSFFVIIVALLVSQDDATSSDAIVKSPRAGMERGKVIDGDTITADDLYNAYREIQSDYHAKAFSSNQPWKVLNRKDGVEVSILHDENDVLCPMVRMKAVIPASVKHCWDFLQLDQWQNNMPKMDPFYEGVSIFGTYVKKGVEMVLARKRMKKLWAFGKRDFVFISVSDLPLKDGTWVSGSVSVVTPKIPRVQGYTRAYQDSIAFYKPLSKDETEVTIVCRIDLNDSAADGSGGSIPMWLYVKTIGTTGARSVINMRRALTEEEEELQLEEKLEGEQQGMLFSVPWQVPAFPHDEEEIRQKQQQRQLRKEKEKRDEEGMRFSLPWQVPVLPHDETKEARKVRGGKNDEPKRLFPFTGKKCTDNCIEEEDKKLQTENVSGRGFALPWHRRHNGYVMDENRATSERLAWRRPFGGVFLGIGKKGGAQ